MHVHHGDRILVRDRTSGTVRDALVLDVHGHDGRPPYLVRWTDTGEEAELVPDPEHAVDRAGPTYPPEYEPEHDPDPAV
ncbi:hypothetical protein GCM10009737_14720 [Nocardioides lentus]|uniref:DUF1918 domain-containing protein n=1 Tax=Nocardioides lentus TaxID=338077 RepID=A0ABN2P8E3_9ACTN